jgi:hypothetical protein
VPAGTSCADDGNVCTNDQCNGIGACAHPNNTASCDDGSVCTSDDVCSDGLCVGNLPPECDDANPCTQDACSDVDGCVNLLEPATGCLIARRGLLRVRDNADDTKDRLIWSWKQGAMTTQEDFGSPDTTTSYRLCVYDRTDGVSSVATWLQLAPNGAWMSEAPNGWVYKDPELLDDGVQMLKLRAGAADGKSSALFKARGANIPMPTPAGTTFFVQQPSVSVQLHNSEGMCWTSTFASSATNTPQQYKAKTP